MLCAVYRQVVLGGADHMWGAQAGYDVEAAACAVYFAGSWCRELHRRACAQHTCRCMLSFASPGLI